MLKERNDIPQRDRYILEQTFINGMTIRELAELETIPSRSGGTLGPSMISYIIKKYVPDWEHRSPLNAAKNKHKNPNNIDKITTSKKRCAFCESTEHLERHHMIPLFLGGTDAPENIIYVCAEHHKIITAYQRNTFKNW